MWLAEDVSGGSGNVLISVHSRFLSDEDVHLEEHGSTSTACFVIVTNIMLTSAKVARLPCCRGLVAG